MATYSIGDLSRREILRMSAALAIGSVASTRFTMAQTTAQRTPEQILGPFYPMKTLDQNADLTKVPGRPGRAAGLVLNVMGRVLNLRGELVRNAKVEIWQANSHGRYTHPSDHNPAPRRVSSGARQNAARAHSLPGFGPARPARDPDVFRRRPLQRNGSFSANRVGPTVHADCQAIAAGPGDGAGVEIGGVRHRIVCGLVDATLISIEACRHG
jgi:intradiol ring-cleaving dioxygenase-like protein